MISLQNIKESLLKKNKFWIALTGDWKKSEWGIRCFNYGYDGSTTKDILDKTDDILAVKSDLLIGVMGGNDPVFDLKVGEHVENIKNIVKKINDHGTKVVWCTSTPAGKNSKKNPEYEPYTKACMSIPENDN